MEKKLGESINAQCGLIGMVTEPDRSRSHGKPAGLNAGLPQHDAVRGVELAGQTGCRNGIQHAFRCQPCSPQSLGRAYYEFPAFHLVLLMTEGLCILDAANSGPVGQDLTSISQGTDRLHGLQTHSWSARRQVPNTQRQLRTEICSFTSALPSAYAGLQW